MNHKLDMLGVAKEAAKTGGDIIVKYYGRPTYFSEKEDKTLVSTVDNESEEEIKRTILRNFPDHAIFGEEQGKYGTSKIVWHIDPLDGTSNFKNRIPFFCASIGIEEDSQFIGGVIYNPLTKELFSSSGLCSLLNEKPIKVSEESLDKGIFVIDASFSQSNRDSKINFQKDLVKTCPRIRMIGSNALQLAGVAQGIYAGSLSDHVNSYDFAAGSVLVKEAGGIVTDLSGKFPDAGSKVVLATNNEQNHKIALEMLRRHY